MAKTRRTKHSKSWKINSWLSLKKVRLMLFIIIFGAVGSVLLWRSFALRDNTAVAIVGTSTNKGYWLATADGDVVPKGDAKDLGSPAKQKLSLRQTITDVAALPNDTGYWALGGDGSIFSYGQAQFYGTPAQVNTQAFYTAIVATPSGRGYWVVSKIGTTFSFGDASTTYKIDFTHKNYEVAYGGIAGIVSVVDADRTDTGRGLYILDQNGKVYVVGDATHRGGIVEQLTREEKATSVAAYNTNSYLITTSLGKVQSRGTGTKNVGDLSSTKIYTSIIGVAKFGKAQDNNVGYWLLGANGNVFTYGEAKDYGSLTKKDVDPDPDPGPAPAEKPDIIVIYTDDQRADEIEFMPNLKKYIIDLGVNFKNAFAINPLCCPSRATLLTGGDSADTGVWNNYSPNGGYSAFKSKERDTIATRLNAKGYKTGLFGKYLNQYQGDDDSKGNPTIPKVPPGWDVWRAFRGVNGRYYNYDLVTGDNQQISYRSSKNGGKDPEQYSTDVLGEHLKNFLKNSPTNKPVFALFTPYAPHTPLEVSPSHANSPVPGFQPRGAFNEEDVSDKPGYIRNYYPNRSPHERPEIDRSGIASYAVKTRKMLLSVDDVIGDIVMTQRARDRINNTVLIFASDNGYSWGEHRLEGKESPYEESIRIPLVVRFDPQTKMRSTTEDKMVINADITATIAAYADTKAPKDTGKSLKPIIAKERVNNWRDGVVIKHYPAEVNGVTDASKSIPAWCGFRSGQYKLIWYQVWSKERNKLPALPSPAIVEGEFYDLSKDPTERFNRFYDQGYASVLRGLWPQLLEACSKPPTHMSRPPANPPTTNTASTSVFSTCSPTSNIAVTKKSRLRSFFNRIGYLITRKDPAKSATTTTNPCTSDSIEAPSVDED